jgi:hypothetical protein
MEKSRRSAFGVNRAEYSKLNWFQRRRFRRYLRDARSLYLKFQGPIESSANNAIGIRSNVYSVDIAETTSRIMESRRIRNLLWGTFSTWVKSSANSHNAVVGEDRLSTRHY